MGKALDLLRKLKTIREKKATIIGKDDNGEDLKIEVLFVEPNSSEHKAAKDRYLKWDQKIKKKEYVGRGKYKEKQSNGQEAETELTLNNTASDMYSYHRELIIMTARDPDTKERMFEDVSAFNGIFGKVDGETRNGDVLLSQFVEHAQEVSVPYTKEDQTKN